MKIQTIMKRFGLALALALLLSLSLEVGAQHVNYQTKDNADEVVVRRTIPDPQAVRRAPLTSDRLSTTSTRYIDARRGFRPYVILHGYGADDRRIIRSYVGYDDHFGISRPEYRPYSYSQRTPRSYVQAFRNDHADGEQADRELSVDSTAIKIIVSGKLREDEPKPDMKIRIHNDRSAIPTTTGAVLITADGTVIQVGD